MQIGIENLFDLIRDDPEHFFNINESEVGIIRIKNSV